MSIAQVKLSTGRWYLDVGGVALAMEADPCRDPYFDENLWTPVMLQEAALKINLSIDKPINND